MPPGPAIYKKLSFVRPKSFLQWCTVFREFKTTPSSKRQIQRQTTKRQIQIQNSNSKREFKTTTGFPHWNVWPLILLSILRCFEGESTTASSYLSRSRLLLHRVCASSFGFLPPSSKKRSFLHVPLMASVHNTTRTAGKPILWRWWRSKVERNMAETRSSLWSNTNFFKVRSQSPKSKSSRPKRTTYTNVVDANSHQAPQGNEIFTPRSNGDDGWTRRLCLAKSNDKRSKSKLKESNSHYSREIPHDKPSRSTTVVLRLTGEWFWLSPPCKLFKP